MTTPNRVRCKDCAYLAEGVKGRLKGKWVCLDCVDRRGNSVERDIESIPDSECSLNQGF